MRRVHVLTLLFGGKNGWFSGIDRLDYSALDLQRFLPGAVIHLRDAFHILSDPFRAPFLALSGLFAPVGNLVDKLRVASLRLQLTTLSPEELKKTDVNVQLDKYLERYGFSQRFINAFFRPFYQGIYLAPLQAQSAAMFAFVFSMFASGSISLPAGGIGAIPKQLASKLPASSVEIIFNARVTSISESAEDPHCLTVFMNTNGKVDLKQLDASAVVVATEGPEAARLLSSCSSVHASTDDEMNMQTVSRGSTCVYFYKNGNPPQSISKPLLVLNGDQGSAASGPVNNMFFPNLVARSYAPPGKTLISTTVVGDAEKYGDDESLVSAVRQQMATWYGQEEVDNWEVLKIYRIPHSQSAQNPDFVFKRDTVVGNGVFVCGDHRNSPTLDGAFESGRDAAEQVLRSMDAEGAHRE